MLRESRLAAGLSQTELAAKLGRPQSFVSDYERGHRRLDWVDVVDVLAACGTDLVEFARAYARSPKR
jgi:transcriptional regulator with XRE-family HTH domain